MRKAKATAVAKPAKPARLPPPVAQRLQRQITSLQRQVTSLKHQAGSGKHPTRKVPVKHSRARGWSPGADVACCSAQAVGTLLGWDDDQVLALYWRTASDPDVGATILDTLEAATELAGVGACRRPVLKPPLRRQFATLAIQGKPWALASVAPESGFSPAATCGGLPPASLILGVDLPGSHTLLATPDGWWSWGEPFNPADWPGMVVEEAWAITWP